MTIDFQNIFQSPVSDKYSKLFYFFLACIPALMLLNFIFTYGVDVPYWDQWTALADLLHRKYTSQIFLRDLFTQHNEHRIFSLRIIVLLTTHLINDWNIKLELFISFTIVTFTAFTLGSLATKDLENPTRFSNSSIHFLGISIFISNLLLFSISQYENWLWGFQIAWFLVVLLLCISIRSLLIFNSTGRFIHFTVAFLSCWIASFTLAQGLFCWLASSPMFLTAKLSGRKRYIATTLWGIGFITSTILYLAGYNKPDSHPSLGYSFSHPLNALNYYFNLIGGSFGKVTGYYPLGLGIIFTLALLFFLITFFYQSNSNIKEGYLPWISISFYVVIFSILTTLGRAEFGSLQALASRYSTISFLIPIALINLWRISFARESFLSRKKSYLLVSVFLIGFLFSSYISGYSDGFLKAHQHRNRLSRGKACLEVYKHMEEPAAKKCLETTLFPDSAFLIKEAEKLQEIGFLNNLDELLEPNVLSVTSNTDYLGEIVSPKTVSIITNDSESSRVIEFSGWADRFFAVSDQSIQGLVFLKSSISNQFFAIGDIQRQSLSSGSSSESQSYSEKGSWYITVPIEALPVEDSIISAYLYDLNSHIFHSLNGQAELYVLNN